MCMIRIHIYIYIIYDIILYYKGWGSFQGRGFESLGVERVRRAFRLTYWGSSPASRLQACNAGALAHSTEGVLDASRTIEQEASMGCQTCPNMPLRPWLCSCHLPRCCLEHPAALMTMANTSEEWREEEGREGERTTQKAKTTT